MDISWQGKKYFIADLSREDVDYLWDDSETFLKGFTEIEIKHGMLDLIGTCPKDSNDWYYYLDASLNEYGEESISPLIKDLREFFEKELKRKL